MKAFFERLLKTNPELHEEVERFRQWGRMIFQGGGIVSPDTDENIPPIPSPKDPIPPIAIEEIFLPSRLFLDPRIPGETPREYEERNSPVPVRAIIYPGQCKFYHGSLALRCAVNPCAQTCDKCIHFEPK